MSKRYRDYLDKQIIIEMVTLDLTSNRDDYEEVFSKLDDLRRQRQALPNKIVKIIGHEPSTKL